MKGIMVSCLMVIFLAFATGCNPVVKTLYTTGSPQSQAELFDAVLHDIPDDLSIDDVIVPMYLPQGKGEARINKQGQQATITADEKILITIDYYEVDEANELGFAELGKMKIRNENNMLSLMMRLNAHIGVVLTSETVDRDDMIKVINSFYYNQGPKKIHKVH